MYVKGNIFKNVYLLDYSDIFRILTELFSLSIMMENSLICKVNHDDELTKRKSSESPLSRSNTPTKTKRTRLTFPFGAW